MTLETNLKNIKEFLLERYKNNLAAILIFGSANTKHFIDGKSDIDHMIFLKKLGGLNLNEESKFLFEKLKPYHFATQYFHTLEGIKRYIKKRKSFSTYITIVSNDGSRILYSTPEFEKTKKWLLNHPLTKQEIKNFIKEKDKFELDGYFKEDRSWALTKGLFSHLRRKLQIMNYFKTGGLVFDYQKCLRNVDLGNKKDFMKLYNLYEKRKRLSEKEIDYYYQLARELSEKIIQS